MRTSSGLLRGTGRLAAFVAACTPALVSGISSGALLGGCSEDGGGFTAGADVQLAFAPEVVDFAAMPRGASSVRTVVVEHVGLAGKLRLRRPRIESASSDLRLEGPASADLGPGEAATWTIVYAPETEEADLGKVLIDHNLPSRPPVEVPISTPGQVTKLSVEPLQLDFGVVPPGGAATRTVTLRALGAKAVEVLGLDLEADADGDFALDLGPDAFLPLSPGDAREVSVVYTPTGRDADEATLRVTATGLVTEVAVSLSGIEVGPVVRAVPETVAFGPVAAGEPALDSVKLLNDGSGTLLLDSISLSVDADPGLSLDGAAGGPFPIALEAGEHIWLDVSYTPGETEGAPDGHLGDVVVTSNDLTHVPLVVPVHGQAGAPVIALAPEDSVDFGFVAQGVTSLRTVAVLNLGVLPLRVDAIEIEPSSAGEMVVVPDPELPPTGSPPAPFEIEPGGSIEVVLAFTNDGGPMGKAFGTLHVRSDDPERPEVLLDLVGHRAGEAFCQLSFVPAVTDFGGVAYGSSKTVDVHLVNDGSAPCDLESVEIDRCESQGIFQVCHDGEASPHFHFAASPPAAEEVSPGVVVAIPVRFDAPGFTGDADAVKRVLARIHARYVDPKSGAEKVAPFLEGGATPVANLQADAGVPRLTVFPTSIDIGWVPYGCSSAPWPIGLFSTGPVAVTVSDASWPSGGDVGFHLDAAPALPLAIVPGGESWLYAAFEPASLGPAAGTLRIGSNDLETPIRHVDVTAEGVAEKTVTEVFEGKSAQDADVLFVVDDSGSMGEEQANLAANFGSFIGVANTWKSDYRIGVVTTDLGKGGKLQGSPPVVTPENWQKFLQNVDVGVDGSGEEQGLAAAKLAIAGSFAPWIRKDAKLVVIYVSDEEDQSPGAVDGYVEALLQVKGGDIEYVVAFAIVGMGQIDCQADLGERYIDVAISTLGGLANICDPSFSEALTDFGQTAFGPKKKFPLGGQAIPGSVEVEVDGVPCTKGWSLDGTQKVVEFHDSSPCLPLDGDTVVVTYDLVCQ